jgi:predicted PhzF superfamily epimerase YddE/YHI9
MPADRGAVAGGADPSPCGGGSGAGAALSVLRVFCAPDGSGGNALGVFLDDDAIAPALRQAVAADLGFSETVFVGDRERAELRIFTPAVELALAGHPLVGTAWLLREERTPARTLRPPAGEVSVRFDGELTFVSADPEWAPRFDFLEVDSPAEVEALPGRPQGYGNVGVWAWLDEGAGTIRERVFAPEEGICEDEATGAAAMRLVAHLGRELEIHQGRGSLIRARTLERGRVEIGGRVVLDEVRSYRPPTALA